MPQLLEGRVVARAVEQALSAALAKYDLKPGLAVVWVGDNPASEIYIRYKQQACERLGFHSELRQLPTETTPAELLACIESLNQNPAIHGILVQMPLPAQLNPEAVIAAIDPAKDVDGFHPINVGYLSSGHPRMVPCTPLGIMQMLSHYQIPIRGRRAVVMGRSNIVGKPMAQLLLQADATVSILHSRTPDLTAYTREADIIVVAVGRRNTLTADMIKSGAVVIDVGMNRLEGRKVVGDVDFVNVAERAGWITPVPGGVGPMTIAMLLKNTWQAALAQ